MEQIDWKEQYSVGIEKIDHQHKQLFKIINKLIAMPPVSSEDSQIVSDILMEMIKYGREHFTTEEMFMQLYSYPEIELHKKEHDYFIKTTSELAADFMENEDKTADRIKNFLAVWLPEHILKTDMRYKPYFADKITTAAQSL